MAIGVALYTLFGGLVLQRLEKKPANLTSVKGIAKRTIEYDEYYKHQNHPWTFTDSLLFTFTIITTIGYGYVAPQTFWGRLFCIFYAFLGIPLTVIALADLGKFISELMDGSEEKAKRAFRSQRKNKNHLYSKITANSETHGSETVKLKDPDNIEHEDVDKSKKPKKSAAQQETERQNKRAIQFSFLFVIYLILGAEVISYYEPDMDFFKAFYFNFVTLTSIGLGDVYPRNNTFLIITIAYISIGLALCTIAFEIATTYLRKLHYFGRKIEKVGDVAIWFGGKKLTMKQLIKNLAEQFNLPVATIKGLDIDKFVEDVIKVENGELDTLRTNPIGPEHVHIELEPFADEDEHGELKWSFRIKFREA
uniref:Potassium channel domain-containing protein n=1 Tax=Acrobeloides nanus TaxID=290746 RepID=A0A914C4V4_9BILA